MGYSKKGVKSKWLASVLTKPSYKKKPSAHIKGGIPHQRELKFVDLASATYTDAITLLNGIATGDDYNTRDGRQATIRSVEVRGTVNTNSAVGTASHRVMVVWDNAPNGAAPAYTDIMTEAATPNTFPNVNNEKRFTILKDWFRVIGIFNPAATLAVSENASYTIDWKIDLKSLTQFSGTGATIASIQSGAIWLVTERDGSTSFTGSTRVRFTEP